MLRWQCEQAQCSPSAKLHSLSRTRLLFQECEHKNGLSSIDFTFVNKRIAQEIHCKAHSAVQSEGDGGAIVITNSQGIDVLEPTQAYKATAYISGTTFINNTAQNGGGIAITNAGMLVSDSLFEYNFATQAGAGRGGAVVG